MTDTPIASAQGGQMTQDKLSEESAWPLGGYAPGHYMCQCVNCGEPFDGDKRAVQCLECAVRSAKAALRSATPMPGVKPVAYLINDPMAGKPEVSFIKTLGIENIPLYTAPPAREISEDATHRHRKRGTEYVLIGYGKMQASWMTESGTYGESVDMREVAIYRSVEDGSLWVRPREEFEDGRFAALKAARSPS